MRMISSLCFWFSLERYLFILLSNLPCSLAWWLYCLLFLRIPSLQYIMKFRFFVVFSRDACRPPKLYKREFFAEKKCLEYPNYAIERFHEEQEASVFLNEKMLESQNQLIADPLATLKTNLSLKPNTKPLAEQPAGLQPQSFIEQSQKQQRQKTVNQILQQHRIFKSGRFKPTIAQVPLNRQYSGFFDGASAGNPGKSAIGYHIDNMDSQSLIARSEFIGQRTNSQAEMTAMILMLADAYCHGIRLLKCYGDSMMAIKFMTGEFNVNNSVLMYYYNAASVLSKKFETVTFTHIGRAYNFKADQLAQKGLSDKQYKLKKKADAKIDLAEKSGENQSIQK